MAQTYLLFDFGADEEKLQQARHKLDGWKQAFRLDKKLQFKFDRGEAPAETSQSAAKPEPGPKSPSKGKVQGEIQRLIQISRLLRRKEWRRKAPRPTVLFAPRKALRAALGHAHPC